jgi:hypothetical protein
MATETTDAVTTSVVGKGVAMPKLIVSDAPMFPAVPFA